MMQSLRHRFWVYHTMWPTSQKTVVEVLLSALCSLLSALWYCSLFRQKRSMQIVLCWLLIAQRQYAVYGLPISHCHQGKHHHSGSRCSNSGLQNTCYRLPKPMTQPVRHFKPPGRPYSCSSSRNLQLNSSNLHCYTLHFTSSWIQFTGC